MSKFLQASVLVHDRRTDIVVQPFADRILVLVTQVGKVGNLIQASIPPTIDLHAYAGSSIDNVSDSQGSLPCSHPAIQLTPIFGSAPSTHIQTLYSLYAAQVATLVWLSIGGAGESRSIVVGIALQRSNRFSEELSDDDQQTFRGVMKALQKMLE